VHSLTDLDNAAEFDTVSNKAPSPRGSTILLKHHYNQTPNGTHKKRQFSREEKKNRLILQKISDRIQNHSGSTAFRSIIYLI
jgi:hypothetical protein